uniref:Eukaryotic peptide chain release factor subunit 1 n=1 Tax=Pan troglodytes TaxID=9598 RepID=A0A2I3RXW8_PANTR
TKRNELMAFTATWMRLKIIIPILNFPSFGLSTYKCAQEKKVNIDFEHFKPINTSLYLCDNKFHTEALTALLSDESKSGFIVIDGSGALFGTLQGNTREVLQKLTVDLPKKHGKGQSALLAETAVQLFISGDKGKVAGLVLAGSADFKTELSQSDTFDQRLQSKVLKLKLVDISYGGENGFNQAVGLSTEVLSKDTGRYCFGVEDTLKALEMGAVEILIAYENLNIMRYQEKDKSHFTDKETRQEHALIKSMPLLKWFANNYKKVTATLEIVTYKSQEGSQFVKGFGRIGGLLRYQVDFQRMEYQGGDDEFFYLDDY